MFITVSLTIDVNATAQISQLEDQIREAGREAMKEAFRQAIKGIEKHQTRCPECESAEIKSQGTKRRVLLTSFGKVEVP